MVTLRLSQIPLAASETKNFAEIAVHLLSDSLSRKGDTPQGKTPSRKEQLSALLRAAIEFHGMAPDEKRRILHFQSAGHTLHECKMILAASGTQRVSLYALQGELDAQDTAETAQSFYAPSVRVTEVPSLQEFVDLAREYMGISA